MSKSISNLGQIYKRIEIPALFGMNDCFLLDSLLSTLLFMNLFHGLAFNQDASFEEDNDIPTASHLHISSTASLDMKYTPVSVLLVEFVCTVLPSFNAPFSTTPPPGLGFLCRALAPLNTVKLARLISSGLRLTIVGIPK